VHHESQPLGGGEARGSRTVCTTQQDPVSQKERQKSDTVCKILPSHARQYNERYFEDFRELSKLKDVIFWSNQSSTK
jgi:hypothetical protein